MVLKEIVVGYFKNFEKIFLIYNMYDKFYLIYNVDEKGILIDYKFFLVVSDLIYCLQVVIFGWGKIIIIFGGGSVSGVVILLFFIFLGKWMRLELLNGVFFGISGIVSEIGWLNGVIFCEYLENYFLKFVL